MNGAVAAALDVLFALATAVLYLCSMAVTATRTRNETEYEKQAMSAIGGAVLVFGLVLWLRLS